MGQYYSPTILKKNWKLAKQPIAIAINTWDLNNGLKLMEHSYIGNGVMKAMEYLLSDKYAGMKVAWVGDYAEEKKTKAYPNGTNLYDKADEFFETSTYETVMSSIPCYEKIPYYKYLVNLSKKEYVTLKENEPNKWYIHPLSILCADGCGLGGGDYYSRNEEEEKMIGSWAYDSILVTNDKTKVKGFKHIKPTFKEDY